VRLYVCGITPYDSGHMGHAFTFCVFDTLVRAVEAAGARVRYVQNVTDVDDPLFARARRDGLGWRELAEREQETFVRDMEALGWRRPDEMPRVSGEIDSILAAVERLADAGYAYEADALYFSASAYSGFGGLSHRSRRSMLRKLRDEELLGEVGPGAKRDPLDFPLWRSSAADEPSWPSRFGPGRPGWHIECSAMALRHLGEQVDVHGGGRDLVFSHHEAERAQSESLTGCVPFAKQWMHTGLVRFEGRKMSKSLGNLVDVDQALRRAPAAAIRLYLLSHRYRRDWEFSWSGLERLTALTAQLRELLGSTRREGRLGAGAGPTADRDRWAGEPEKASAELRRAFKAALRNDLDTSAAIRALRKAAHAGDADAAAWMLGILAGTAALA
jgi:L-cysteine:1D-myo-inositol 2-amino-2-deoxy-alpha-D-glucopyranoside ligase